MNIYGAYQDEINKHYQIVDVTQGGIDYILERLRFGCTLSNLVARYILIEHGKVETFLHRSINKHRAVQFNKGYINQTLPESIKSFPKDGSKLTIDPAMSFFIAPTIQEFLAKSEQNICILEDLDSSPQDRWLTTSEIPPMFTFDDTDVYFFISEENPTIATVREIISMASAPWSTKIFLTSIPSSVNSPKLNQQLDMKSLITIAKNTEKIIVSAYDGEGYLMWHRSQPPKM